jgi:hypothetical protein
MITKFMVAVQYGREVSCILACLYGWVALV